MAREDIISGACAGLSVGGSGWGPSEILQFAGYSSYVGETDYGSLLPLRKLWEIFNWLALNWERLFFIVLGILFFITCLDLIALEKVTESAVVFGIGFLCFLYANVARFKRFKGLGFEAELWEDKQKEAADLIQKLREIVTIYTSELVVGRIRASRWGSGTNWRAHWKLYSDLISQHESLGQKIDFSTLKKTVDDYFLFDLTMPQLRKIQDAIRQGVANASRKLTNEFGTPIKDIEAYGRRTQQLHEISTTIEDAFDTGTTQDLALCTLNLWHASRSKLKDNFGVDIEVESAVFERLRTLSEYYQSRPVQVTDKLLRWADGEQEG